MLRKSFFNSFFTGRLSKNMIFSGNVVLNGKKRSLDHGGVVSNLPIFANYKMNLMHHNDEFDSLHIRTSSRDLLQ